MFNIEFYVNEKGEVPVRDYLRKLKKKAKTDKKTEFSMKRYITILGFWNDLGLGVVKNTRNILRKIFGN